MKTMFSHFEKFINVESVFINYREVLNLYSIMFISWNEDEKQETWKVNRPWIFSFHCYHILSFFSFFFFSFFKIVLPLTFEWLVMNNFALAVELGSSFEPSVSDKIPASPLRVPPSPSRFSMSPKLSRLQSLHLNLSQVSKATRNFSETLQIGEGGFGTVYKAHLDDGLVVAVKRAKRVRSNSWYIL